MPVSGVIVTLSEDPTRAQEALGTIGKRPEVGVGEGNGPWVPVVVDTATERESRTVHDWLLTVPGVRHVDVVYVEFDSDPLPARGAVAASRESLLELKSN